MQLQEVLESSVNFVFIFGPGFLPNFGLNSEKNGENLTVLHIDLTPNASFVSVCE